MIGAKRHLAALLAALLVFVTGATTFVFELPVFEGPDEPGHYDYAFKIDRVGERPWVAGTADGVAATSWDESSMSHHPTLYYWLLVGVARTVSGSLPVLTPRFEGAVPPNNLRHGQDESTPRSREVRLFLLLRGVSVVCGALSLVLLWLTARRLAPNEPRVAAIATFGLACLPQWQHAHAVLDNGALGTTLCFAAIAILAHLWMESNQRRDTTIAWRAALALGVVIGLALATKLTAILLLPLALVVAVRAIVRSEQSGAVALRCGAAIAIVAGCVAPFVLQNLERYGEPLARGVHARAYAINSIESIATSAGLDVDATRNLYLWHYFLGELAHSLIGEFGWGGVSVPEHSLWLWAIVAALAALGWIVGRARVWRVLLVAAPIAIIALAQVVAYNHDFHQPQGRYLFPGIGGFALVVGGGVAALAGWLDRRIATGVLMLAAAALATDSLLTAFVVVPAAYSGKLETDRYLAAFVDGVGQPPSDSATTIEVLEPEDGATLDAPPTLRFAPPASALTTIHIWRADGQFIGSTFDHLGVELREGLWTMSAEHWSSLPSGTELWWQVRVVPNRAQHESGRDSAASVPRRLIKR